MFVSLEKSRLCSSLFGFYKVAQTDPDEPISLLSLRLSNGLRRL